MLATSLFDFLSFSSMEKKKYPLWCKLFFVCFLIGGWVGGRVPESSFAHEPGVGQGLSAVTGDWGWKVEDPKR